MSNHILVINLDEVYHSGLDVSLQGPLRMELNHLTGLGYAKASDILRLLVLDDFGGAYTDGDNTFNGAEALVRDFRDVLNGRGIALHLVHDGVGNSAFVAVRGHPFIRAMIRRIEGNYARTQAQLIAPHEPGRAGSARFVTHAADRFSVVHRTGPHNLWHSGFTSSGNDLHLMPSLGGFGLQPGASWHPRSGRPLDPVRTWSEAETVAVLRAVVASLIRDLFNRDGDLHLTVVASVVAGLSNRDSAWRAVLAYLLEEPRLRGLIETATDRVLVRGNGPHGMDSVRVVLPPDVAEQFGLVEPADGGDPRGAWRLAELMRPVQMQGQVPVLARVLAETDSGGVAENRTDLQTVFLAVGAGGLDLSPLDVLGDRERPLRIVPAGGVVFDEAALASLRVRF